MGRNDTKEVLFLSYKELGKKKKLDKITVREICENCGLTTQTFYNYFSDKYDMILWNHRKRVDELAEKYMNGSETFEEILSRYVWGFSKHADFVLNAYRSTKGQDSYMTRSTGYMMEKIKEVVKLLSHSDTLPEDIEFYIEMYSIALSAMIAKWVVQGRIMPAERLVELLMKAAPYQLRDYVTENAQNC